MAKTKKKAAKTKQVSKEEKATISPYITDEALAWMNSWVWDKPKKTSDDPEPMAYPPMWYTGPATIQLYSEAVGHPLTLEEVQYMVRRDGDGTVEHWATGVPFIPIVYAFDYIPEAVLQKLRDGVSIQEAGIYVRGQFNIIKGKEFPVAGCVYHEIEVDGEKAFDYAYQSPLVDLAYSLARKYKKRYPVWTCVSRERIQKRHEKNQQRQEMKDANWEMIRMMDEERKERENKKRKRVTVMEEAFAHRGTLKGSGRQKQLALRNPSN